MAGFLTSASASLTTGTKLITISGNVDCSFVVSGTAVYLNNILMEGVSGTAPDPSGNSSITLRNLYTGSSIIGGTLVAFNTIEGLRDAIQRARELAATQVTNNSQLDTFLTNATTSVDLELPSGTVTVSPYQYISGLVLGNDVKQYAMSQAQFEEIRVQNKDKYAASGWVSFGNHESDNQVNEYKSGLYTALTTPNTLLIGKADGVGGSKTDHGVLCIAGVIFHLPLAYQVKLAQAPDGKTTYNKATGVITNHATVAAAFNAQAVDPVNIEVVINRVDMWGFEAFPQEVTITNPEIYPQGVFSDLFTSMNGIPTSDSSRPVSYFGFLGKKAKKVDFFAISDAQKKKVLADPKNKLYYSDDGRLIQWVLRGREFTGFANGDWGQTDSSTPNTLRFDSKTIIKAQGIFDAALQPNGVWDTNSYFGTDSEYGSKIDGVFSSKKGDTSASIFGECYFLVCGTINRMNCGAYSIGENPSGSAIRVNKGNTHQYYEYGVQGLFDIDSISSCFNYATNSSGVGVFGGDYALGSAFSGRTEKRYNNIIYASGVGGVCDDVRFLALKSELSDIESSKKVLNSQKSRGRQFEIITKPTKYIISSIGTYAGGVYFSITGDASENPFPSRGSAVYFPKTGEVGYVSNPDANSKTFYVVKNKKQASNNLPFYNPISTVGLISGDEIYGMVESESVSSISGFYIQNSVIGSPVNIFNSRMLNSKNGFLGIFIPMIPNGSNVKFQFSRKLLSAGSHIFSNDSGSNWTYAGAGHGSFDYQDNSRTYPAPLSEVAIHSYTASSYSLKVAGLILPAYLGRCSISSFIITSNYRQDYGCLLSESMIGEVLRSNTGVINSDAMALSVSLDSSGAPSSSAGFFGITHHELSLSAPDNDSPALKYISYPVIINKKIYIQYLFTMMKYSDSWNDNGRQDVNSGTSIKIDDIGIPVLQGSVISCEPVGWV